MKFSQLTVDGIESYQSKFKNEESKNLTGGLLGHLP